MTIILRTGFAVASLVATTFGTATALAAGPADWPRWRGHEGGGQGGDVAVPRGWTAADWKWQATLPGQGHGSPVVFRGGVYTAAADEAAGKRFLTCHDAADGGLRWQREFAGPIEPHHAQNSSASGTVAASDDGVFWLWATKDNLRVEAFTPAGEPLWHADLGPYACEHGFGASPAVWRDLVIVPIDHDGPSAIVALDAKTGRERWRVNRETGRAAYSTPLVIDHDAGSRPQVVVASNGNGLTGLDPATGALLWETKCFPRRTVSSPMLAGPLVICTCGEGGGDNLLVAIPLPTALPAAGDPPLAPEPAYTLDRSVAPYVPTPVCSGERLYLWGDRGVVTCVKAGTGETLWRGRVGGMFSASPIVVGDCVINVSADGEVVMIADGDAFEVLGRMPLGDTCRATPAAAGGRIYFRTASRLFAL
jgi:outer membrane protein assembly factor BamB